MNKIEALLVVLLGMALTLHYSEMAGAPVFLQFSLGVLIAFYFITGVGLSRKNSLIYAFKHGPREERAAVVMRHISSLTFACCMVTIGMNEFFRGPFEALTIVSIIALTVVMFFSMLSLENAQPQLNRAIVFRAGILSAALLYYSLMPLKQQISWHYEDIYYRELLHYALENPDDEEAQRDLFDYRQRMNGFSQPE
ncbi:MAG: hypothetical protein ACK478_07440 [Flavobacteriales bacterium]|jgi:hypothetical protein